VKLHNMRAEEWVVRGCPGEWSVTTQGITHYIRKVAPLHYQVTASGLDTVEFRTLMEALIYAGADDLTGGVWHP